MSSTHLDNSSFQATLHKEHRNHIVVTLLAEGSVVVVLMAVGWWGMANLGSYTLVSQIQLDPIYVAGCPVPDPLQKSSARVDVGKGTGCSHEGSTHPVTSRQPGVGLGGQAHEAERQRDDRVPLRTSENSPSTHSGEIRARRRAEAARAPDPLPGHQTGVSKGKNRAAMRSRSPY